MKNISFMLGRKVSEVKKRKMDTRKKLLIGTLVALLVIGGASAALLTYYGTVVGTTTAMQSVKIDGHNWNEPVSGSFTLVGGNNVSQNFTITNDANVSTLVNLTSAIEGDGAGITVTYKIDSIPVGEGIDFEIPANSGVTLTINVDTAVNLKPGTYTITTTLNV